MKNFILLLFIGSYFCAFSQTRSIEPERSVTTSHYVTVKGSKISYTATAGTLPVWSDEDKAVATLFYTYYKRSDVKDNPVSVEERVRKNIEEGKKTCHSDYSCPTF